MHSIAHASSNVKYGTSFFIHSIRSFILKQQMSADQRSAPWQRVQYAFLFFFIIFYVLSIFDPIRMAASTSPNWFGWWNIPFFWMWCVFVIGCRTQLSLFCAFFVAVHHNYECIFADWRLVGSSTRRLVDSSTEEMAPNEINHIEQNTNAIFFIFVFVPSFASPSFFFSPSSLRNCSRCNIYSFFARYIKQIGAYSTCNDCALQ